MKWGGYRDNQREIERGLPEEDGRGGERHVDSDGVEWRDGLMPTRDGC